MVFRGRGFPTAYIPEALAFEREFDQALPLDDLAHPLLGFVLGVVGIRVPRLFHPFQACAFAYQVNVVEQVGAIGPVRSCLLYTSRCV